MKVPILILGYERSGTTLLRRLVSMHPNLEYELIHERFDILLSCKSRKDAYRKLTYPATQAGKKTGSIMSVKAGKKIPYLDSTKAKQSINKFEKLFGKFYIIHIVRNPIDVISSQIKTFNRKIKKCVNNYNESVVKIRKYVKSKGGIEIAFEDLVSNATVKVNKLYRWMGDFDKNDEYIQKVIATRDPWIYDGRIMPGLRYFDSIQNNKSKNILNKKQIAFIGNNIK